METTNFIRQILDRITPIVLKGKTEHSEKVHSEIILHLKKQACIEFAKGNLNEATEINDFISSKPKFQIWPGNGLLFMNQSSNDPEAKNKIIVYADEKHLNGYEELVAGVDKILERREQ